MRVKSIKIQNYKSFAEINNMIELDTINTIIGKNESGKSNLIEGIGKINLMGMKDNQFFENCNKNYPEKQPCISIVLNPYPMEKDIYKSRKETILTIKNKFDIEIEGGLTDVISNDKNFQENRTKMNELSRNIRINDEMKQKQLLEIKNMIENAELRIFTNRPYISSILSILEKNSSYMEFTKYLKLCIKSLTEIYSIFPQFILLDNIELKTEYTKKNLDDKNEPKTMLKYLLKAIDIEFEELMNYWKLRDESYKYNFEKKMNKKMENLINQFNNFYGQEEITLEVKFDKDSLNFLVKTTDTYLNLSERSNGLKWYLNMYIQLIAKTKRSDMENYVILMDEPGVYLHVNAQKEILRLFEDFASKDNQIIYTTQLPTMIYQNDLYRVRTIIKDQEGNSHIGNKYNSLPHGMESKMETITPLLKAIGMKMGYSFSAMSIDKVNIITEGISDCNYIKAYLLQKKYEKEVNIIPSSGVDNIHNLVSILIGWGYKYKIFIDQDREGRKQYKVLTKKLLVKQDDIKFTDGTAAENNSVNLSIEDIFSTQDKLKIGINNQDYSTEKAYYSLEVLKKVESNEYRYNGETMKNFENIFDEWLN